MSTVMDRKTVLIIDANNMVHRCRHAMKPLSTAGKDVTIIYGFLKSLIAEMRRYDPVSVIVCWDGGIPAFRREVIPEYKMSRKDKDKDPTWPAVMAQMDELREILPKFGVVSVMRKDIEADDLMHHASGMLGCDRVVIVTTDMDMYQSISPHVMIHSPVKDIEVTFYNFEKTTEVPWGRWLLYRLLTGDSSDNVRGIKGVGHKTALQIMDIPGMLTFYDLLTSAINKDIRIPTAIRESLVELGYAGYTNLAKVVFLLFDNTGARRAVLDEILLWEPFDSAAVVRYMKSNAFVSLMDPEVYNMFAKMLPPMDLLGKDIHSKRFPTVPPRRSAV